MTQHWHFQIHLSTAVLLMLAAGVLIWANTREREELVQSNMDVVTYAGGQSHFGMLNTTCYGWPANAVLMLPAGSSIEIPKGLRGDDFYSPAPHWNYLNAAVDLTVAGVLVVFVWRLSERFLARGRAGERLQQKIASR